MSAAPAPRTFGQAVAGEDAAVDVARAALLIAREEYPDLDPEVWISRLDALGASFRACLPVDTSADPHLGAERGEALGFAVLLLLERLTPNERAAYVLREAFDYPYAQIAEIVQVSEAAVRQLVSRARKHVASERRAPVSGDAQRKLLATFVTAARSGDLAALEELLAADVVSYSDGGGVVRASRIPVVGAERVAKYHRAFAERFWAGVEVSWATTNGQASAVLGNGGTVFAVLTVTASDQGIDQVLWMMNPAKITAAAGRTTGSA